MGRLWGWRKSNNKVINIYVLMTLLQHKISRAAAVGVLYERRINFFFFFVILLQRLVSIIWPVEKAEQYFLLTQHMLSWKWIVTAIVCGDWWYFILLLNRFIHLSTRSERLEGWLETTIEKGWTHQKQWDGLSSGHVEVKKRRTCHDCIWTQYKIQEL